MLIFKKRKFMLRNIAIASATVAVLMSGCSSYPSDAKGVAKAGCEAFKALDFDGMKKYSVKSSHAEIDKSAAQFAKLDKLPKEQQGMATMVKAMIKSMKCDNPQIEQIDETHASAKFGKPMGKMKLEKIDGQWKIVK